MIIPILIALFDIMIMTFIFIHYNTFVFDPLNLGLALSLVSCFIVIILKFIKSTRNNHQNVTAENL